MLELPEFYKFRFHSEVFLLNPVSPETVHLSCFSAPRAFPPVRVTTASHTFLSSCDAVQFSKVCSVSNL